MGKNHASQYANFGSLLKDCRKDKTTPKGGFIYNTDRYRNLYILFKYNIKIIFAFP